MFDYVKDKEFLSHVRNLCGEIMQDFCHYLKEDYDIGAVFYLVGSGAKNLIVQNASLPIDLDYNLEIVRCEDFEDCRLSKGFERFHCGRDGEKSALVTVSNLGTYNSCACCQGTESTPLLF